MRNFAKIVTVAAFSFATAASADQGVSDTEIKFAQVAAIEGPAAALGTGMQSGILAAFAEVNSAGGVFGRTLTLDSIDDGYEPSRSIDAVKSVIQSDEYLGLIGPVGTPTTKATQPIATAADMPVIGPFTGAGFLRDPALKNVINMRASYDAETAAWVDHLVDDLGYSNIAILYQDDGFGRVGLSGVTKALDARGMALSATGTYTRNTVAVKSALLEIRKAKPEAIVMVGAYKPLSEFVKLAKKMRMDPTFVTISFVGSKALSTELGTDGEGVIISQVVPQPWDTSIPVVADYQAALKAHDPSVEPGFVSLEGYLTGRLAIEALKAAGSDLTRETYLSAMSGLRDVDFGGFPMVFGPGDNQGSDGVFLTRILPDGSFESVSPTS
ncbi:amino acid/amide ABC transporter substrate-binding protein (HAAT family) [Pacificibacter maritimus]|uniref:Amino acid/amide ABC transporter substrate-binding protein (HAAT family) n=1 Tax=Pacificibacter maritimus TaxID=762213 RepID=A0A3N4UC88_9RHOB|nr:ABC transporter substrate-binding protein [Pacificibacter maritimus]RPE62917.1 amino acid/amide ABC transporter substrate-binding protein (HAAT family) [Pacificibacter maritimus]